MTQAFTQCCCRLYDKAGKQGTTLQLRVQPRASQCGPVSMFGEQVKWGVRAAASDGAANREVIESLAEYFGLARSAVEILSGESSRSKVVLLQGILPDPVLGILNS